MAQLLVRDLDEKLVAQLKARAREHGVSAEEEHRRILKDVLNRPKGKKQTLIEFLVSEEGAVYSGDDLDLDRPRDEHDRDPGF